MRKIQLEPMIKRPASPGTFGTVLIAITLLVVLGLSCYVAGHRLIAYSEYLATRNV